MKDINPLHWDKFSDMVSMYSNLLSSGIKLSDVDENDLGNGMRLVSIFEVRPELLENKQLIKEIGSTSDYSFLFKDDKQISDLVFRKGGISQGFGKNNYANLIVYYNFFEKAVESDYGRTWGTQCLVDLEGRIVLKEKGLSKYPSYLKGVIGRLENGYYDLRTSELIVMGNSSFQSEDYLFVQKQYDFEWYGGKEQPKGVYKIHFETAEVEYFK